MKNTPAPEAICNFLLNSCSGNYWQFRRRKNIHDGPPIWPNYILQKPETEWLKKLYNFFLR